MHAKHIIALVFIGIGSYLICLHANQVFGLLALSWIAGDYRDDTTHRVSLITTVGLFMPFAFGVLIVAAAKRLGRIVSRLAGLGAEFSGPVAITPEELLRVILVGVGTCLLFTTGASVIADVVILTAQVLAQPYGVWIARLWKIAPDLVARLFTILSGVMLIRYAARIATKLAPNGQPA